MTLLIVAVAVALIFLTTPRGRRVAAWLGVSNPFRGGVDRDTRRYLLDACGGSRAELARRIEAERSRFPELDEAALYRRAVRTLMNERGGPRPLDAQ